MNKAERNAILEEIKHWKEEEKRVGIPCLYSIKRLNLQAKLDWDDYLSDVSTEGN